MKNRRLSEKGQPALLCARAATPISPRSLRSA